MADSYTINGKKIKASSRERAQYIYDKEYGSNGSSSSSRTSTPTVPTNSYQGGSIVDYLNTGGQASDFNSRSSLATKYGISGYQGTADQNTKLLAALRSGGSTSTKSTDNARSTYIKNTSEGLANAGNLSATTPEETQRKVSGTPDYKQQYVDFLTKAYPARDVGKARESLDELQKRIQRTSLTSRHEEDRIRTNESGAMARGISGQLNENERVTSRELGDLGIAAAPFESLLQGAEGAYKTLANLEDPATAASKGKAIDRLTTAGSITSGNLNYSNTDYTEDANALETSRGGDGWVDPSVYQRLYQNWITSGGTADDFVNLYPPERYSNPANTWLPAILRNGGAGGGRTQVVEIGGRRVLINADTGDTIRDLGVALGTGGGDSGWGI